MPKPDPPTSSPLPPDDALVADEAGHRSACIKLTYDDEVAIRLISDYLATTQWTPYRGSVSTAVRFALRQTVAVLASSVQREDRRQRTSRRRKKKPKE